MATPASGMERVACVGPEAPLGDKEVQSLLIEHRGWTKGALQLWFKAENFDIHCPVEQKVCGFCSTVPFAGVCSALPANIEQIDSKWNLPSFAEGLIPTTIRVGKDVIPTEDPNGTALWFLKATKTEAGKGVRVVSDIKNLPAMDPDIQYILQRQPDGILFDAHGHKRVVRAYLLLICFPDKKTQFYMYQHGRVTISPLPYDRTSNDVRVHIQNDYHCVSADLRKGFDEKHGYTSNAADQTDGAMLLRTCHATMTRLARRIEPLIAPVKRGHFALFGVDFLHATPSTRDCNREDTHMAFVLELNHRPGINVTEDAEDHRMIMSMLDMVFDPDNEEFAATRTNLWLPL